MVEEYRKTKKAPCKKLWNMMIYTPNFNSEKPYLSISFLLLNPQKIRDLWFYMLKT